MTRENNGAKALNVITKDSGAVLSANMEVRTIPTKNGTTTLQRRTSRLEPKCNVGHPHTSIIRTVNAICIATRVQGNGKELMANLLKTSMPTEQSIHPATAV